jgi:hypothetical protein
LGFCGSAVVDMKSVPSRPNAMRDVPAASATKMSRTPVSARPSHVPRAIATVRRFSSSGFV